MPEQERYLKITFVRTDGFTQLVTVGPNETVLIGRDLGCDCRLEGRKVSRRHVRFTFHVDGTVHMQDNGSHNGSYVNGVRIVETKLSGGEVVTVGEWEGRAEFVQGPVRKRTEPGAVPQVPSPSQPVLPQAGLPQQALSAPGMVSAIPSLPQTGFVSQGRSSPLEAGSAPVAPLPRSVAFAASQQGSFDGPTDAIQSNGGTSVWRWDSPGQAEVTSETMRVAPVAANPIVQRLTQSSANLDFRGLGALEALPKKISEPLTQVSGLNVDAVALQLVFRVTEALNTAKNIDEFLKDMTDSLCQAARAKAVVVLLSDDATGELVPRVVKNRRQEESVQLSRTVIEAAVSQRVAITTEDAGADERFASGESVLRFDLKAVLAVPLIMGSQEVFGAVYMTRDLPFSNTERDLVAALTHLVAMGIDRARLRERIADEERQRRALERFHAPDVVRRLMMEHDAPASARGNGLFLETLTATVLFCDLSGFTAYCESRPPEEVGALLNLYLGGMTEIVFDHGGTVDKYIGDAIMCIFGAPFGNPDDAMRAVKCAMKMREEFRRVVTAGAGGDAARALKVHIGINTGPVVAGTVGSSLRMEYTALGDTVNIAARLEGVAKSDQIVIGPSTAELVREEIRVASLGAVTLKGRGSAVEVFEVPEVFAAVSNTDSGNGMPPPPS